MLLMGVSGLEVAATELVAHGKAATTPVAIVESGFSPAAAHHGRNPRDASPSSPASATCNPRRSSSSAPSWTCTRSWDDRRHRWSRWRTAAGTRRPASATAVAAGRGPPGTARPDTCRRRYLDHDRAAAGRRSPRTLSAEPFVVVPLLLGAAYHSRVDIPAALAPAGARSRRPTCSGRTRCSLAALERRLAEAGVEPGDPRHRRGAGSRRVDRCRGSWTTSGSWLTGWRRAGWWDVRAGVRVGGRTRPSRRRSAGCAPPAHRGSRWRRYLLFPGLFADKLARSRRRRHVRAAGRRPRGRHAGPRAATTRPSSGSSYGCVTETRSICSFPPATSRSRTMPRPFP